MLHSPRFVRSTRLAIRTCFWAFCWCLWSCAGLYASDDHKNPVASYNSEQATSDSEVGVISSNPLLQRAQHLARLGVTRWHSSGYRGRALKIAVLDTGFRGYVLHLGGALPAHVAARSFRGDGDLEAKNSQHGILCAEVLHSIAPEAELFLANWDPDRPDEFLEAVRWARKQGARIISCSLIMPSWGDSEGGGAIHAALAKLLGNGDAQGDMLCFASAGNTAQRHWSGEFHASASGFQEWQPGQE